MIKKQFISEKEKNDLMAKIYASQIKNTLNFSYNLIISLTDMCNLNCTNCQTFCKKENKSFTTLNDLKISIPILKKKLNNCSGITLFGGEPLLNPEIKDICQFLRNEYPNLPIEIFTNGLLLANWEEQDYYLMKQLNIKFLITLYPLKQAINIVSEQEKIFKKHNIQVKIHGTRPYFCKTDYNKEGKSDIKKRFFSCYHASFPPTFYLHKDKLFKCGVTPGFLKINLPISNEDYLKIDELEMEKVLEYCSKPLNACKYCGFLGDYGSDEIFIWHQQNDLKSEYFMTLMDLYVQDYNSYYKFCHDCSHILPILKNEYFLSKYINEEYISDPFNIYLNRFFNGIGDVLIPFDKYIVNNLQFLYKFKDNLLSQKNYSKINFYFISIDGDKKAKEIMYKTFTPTSCDIKGNFYFLEELDNNKIQETFFSNSYLPHKFILNLQENNLKFLIKNNSFLSINLRSNNNETI